MASLLRCGPQVESVIYRSLPEILYQHYISTSSRQDRLQVKGFLGGLVPQFYCWKPCLVTELIMTSSNFIFHISGRHHYRHSYKFQKFSSVLGFYIAYHIYKNYSCLSKLYPLLSLPIPTLFLLFPSPPQISSPADSSIFFSQGDLCILFEHYLLLSLSGSCRLENDCPLFNN